MLGTFTDLERTWLEAVQTRDVSTLENLLDEFFVCTPWSSKGELLLRRDYLDEVERAVFRSCEVAVLNVQMLESFAIVKCRLDCDFAGTSPDWRADLLVTDVWVRKSNQWKALNRHTSLTSEVPQIAGSRS